MRQTKGRRLVILLVLSCLALATAAVGLADTVLNQRVPYTATTFNDCTDEIVIVEGMLHTTTRFSTSGGGRVHQGVHVQSAGVKGTAVPSGARYIEKNVENQQTNFISTASTVGRPRSPRHGATISRASGRTARSSTATTSSCTPSFT